MSNITIPLLPPVIALSGAEFIEVVQAGTSSRATVSQLASALGTYTAGTGLTLSGNQFSVTATGVTAGGYTVPSFSVNAQGQITSITSGATTGTGAVVLANSPTLVAPALGTPTAVTLTNAVGLPLSTGITGTLTFGNGGTGLTATPSNGQLLIGNGTGYSLATLTAGSNITITNTAGGITIASTAGGSGTVTSVNASGGTTGLSFSGGPVTTSGTLTLAGTLVVANGGTGVTTSTGSGSVVLSNNPTLVTPALGVPSAITLTNATGLPLSTGVTGTLPVGNGGTGVTTTPANGALLIGNGSGYTSATLTAGSNITITNTAGGITIASTGGGGMVYPGAGIAVSTGSAWATSLSSTAPTFTTSVTSPSVVITSNSTTTTLQGSASATATTYTLPASAPGTNGYVLSSTTGGVLSWISPAGSGTVTSVSGSGGTTGLTLTGGPITTSGTLTLGGTLAVANGGTGVATTPVNGALLIGNGSGYTVSTLTAGSNITITNTAGGITIASTAGGSGTVTSVNASGGTTGLSFSGGPVTTSGTLTLAGTLAVANGGTGVTTSTGTGSVVLSNSPTLVTPALGTPSSVTLTNATGLPVSTGITGLGTGVATALGVNVGTAGSFVINGGALGTPSSGTVTNLTGTASININGTVGATTPTTGAFTTVSASTNVASPLVIITSNATTTTLQGSASATATTYTLPASAPGTSGYVLSSTTAGVMSWVAASAGTVTSVSGSGGTTGLTLTGGPITTSGTLTLGGTLAVANGGTGVTTSTGTGSVVLSNSPTLVTPALGTPTAIVLTNATGLPLSTGVTGTLSVGNGGTGLTSLVSGYIPYGNGSSALASASNFTFNGTSLSAPFYIATGTITGSINAGAYSYGTLAYSDNDIFSSFTLNVNNYVQTVLQNTSSGSSASVDHIVSNNSGTATTFFGDFGMNSSTFTGTGSLNLANAVYLYSNSGDLVLGTATSNAIHFVVNSGATDAVTIATTGKTTFQASSTTAASINLTPGAAPTSPVNGDMWSTSAGVYAQVNGSTVGPFGTGGGGGTLTVGTTATSGGAAGQIMFDTGSVLSESSSLTFASATRKLTVAGPTTFSAGTSNSIAAWSTNGANFIQSAATFTDNTTAASGTVTTAYMNLFGAQTYAATNTGISVSTLYGTYFQAPLAGTNVGAVAKWAAGADSLFVNGSFSATAGAYSILFNSSALQLGSNSGNTQIFTANGSIAITASSSGTISLGSAASTGTLTVGLSAATQTTNIQAGATSSGNTKTINIGTGGLSGSTTTIAIGSTAAPGVVTVNGSYQPLTVAVGSAGTITPSAGTTNQYNVTALAASALFAAPSGIPVDGQRLTIRIKDNGTAQSISWTTSSGGYRAVGVTLPTTTVASKALYVGCIYNSQDTFWDVVAVAQL